MVLVVSKRWFIAFLSTFIAFQSFFCTSFGSVLSENVESNVGILGSQKFQGFEDAADRAMRQFQLLEKRILSHGQKEGGINYRVDVSSDSTPPPSVCETRTKESIFVYGKCPDACLPFSTEKFIECGSLIQLGCTMKPCTSAPGQFTCTLREDLTAGRVVCPGDKIVFDDVTIDTLQKVSYKIDLKAPPIRTDLYLLSDATGSMRTAVKTVKSKFLDLITVFGTRENVAFGSGYYRDESELSGGFKNEQAITVNTNLVRNAVNRLVAIGGGDGDEANLVALYQVATSPSIGWRDNSRRILVYFGDWPGHEPTCVGSKRLTRSEVISALKAKRITVIGVSFPPPGLDGAPSRYLNGSCDSAGSASIGQGTAITTSTMGTLESSTDQAKLISAISSAVRNLTSTFDVDESECKENIDSFHTPALPIILESNEAKTVTNTISLKDNVCDIVGPFECRYKYTESGADLRANAIEFVNIRGCPVR